MATTYSAPLYMQTPVPNFSLPTNAAAQQVPSPFPMAPPQPLPQTFSGSNTTTSYST